VGLSGCGHVVLPLLSATIGVHLAHMAVPGHPGAGGHSSAVGCCSHHRWLAPSSRCWGGLVGLSGCAHMVLPLLSATSGAHQALVAVWRHPAGAAGGGSCGHYGWPAQSSGCWGAPVVPKGGPCLVLPLLAATSGAHQAQMVAGGYLTNHFFSQEFS